MKRFLALLCAAALLPASANSQATDEDRMVQASYQESVMARGARRPDIAEKILRELIRMRPKAPQLRFDLGVALAEQGRCVAAARAFDAGQEISGLPSFERAVQVAMEDLCPGLAPFDFSVSGTFVYDSNANAGAGDQSITVGGVPLLLSRDAVAQESFGFVASADLAYNYRLTGSSYLVPSIGFAVADFQGRELDSYSITPTLSFRYQGDRLDWRLGPTAVWSYDADGLTSTGSGLVARASLAISPRTGLYGDASYLAVEDSHNPLGDYKQNSLGATLIHNPAGRTLSLRAGLTFTDRDFKDDFQDLKSVQFSLGVSGNIAPKIGYDLSYSRRVNRGSMEHYLFGEKREDTIQTLTGGVSFAKFEGWYGRPYIGISYSISESSWDTKTYDRSRVLFGLTRRF